MRVRVCVVLLFYLVCRTAYATNCPPCYTDQTPLNGPGGAATAVNGRGLTSLLLVLLYQHGRDVREFPPGEPNVTVQDSSLQRLHLIGFGRSSDASFRNSRPNL
jgi:hypothetical protein